MLADSFGRIATGLRVSVTDRCNLRCRYCMPAEGLDWLASPALLSDGEMARLIAIAVQQLGITEVRFTGGEPLLRRGLAGLIAAAAALRPRPEISVTTNGVGLARLAGPLRDAGLDRINVSLHTLSPQTFVTLARRGRLADVLAGLAAAAAAGLAPAAVPGDPVAAAPSHPGRSLNVEDVEFPDVYAESRQQVHGLLPNPLDGHCGQGPLTGRYQGFAARPVPNSRSWTTAVGRIRTPFTVVYPWRKLGSRSSGT